ncbi:MAG: DpnI domain-containing protein [Armatimonadota bacterium]
MNTRFAPGYKSPCQIARRLTEDWVARIMFCPACTSARLGTAPVNARVVDFECPRCKARFQLKAQRTRIANRITGAAYAPVRQAIEEGNLPHLLLLQYDAAYWSVVNMILIPSQFITSSVIEKRQPLRASAVRAGWQGCCLLLDRIPASGRIAIVTDSKMRPRQQVREQWQRFQWIGGKPLPARSWIGDVLACLHDLDREQFVLSDVYNYYDHLRELHPDNRNIHAKIRQQLQLLRENRIIVFDGGGRYRMV